MSEPDYLRRKRVALERMGSYLIVSCTRCPATIYQGVDPIDLDTWTYNVMHHECNAEFYTDTERERAARKVSA